MLGGWSILTTHARRLKHPCFKLLQEPMPLEAFVGLGLAEDLLSSILRVRVTYCVRVPKTVFVNIALWGSDFENKDFER